VPEKPLSFTDASEVFEYIKDEKNHIHFVACIITNVLGQFFKCFFDVHEISLDKLKNGFSFDASSIKLYADTGFSDFCMKIDFETCFLETSNGTNVLNFLCYVKNYNGYDYYKCPRTIIKNACLFIKKEGIADNVYIGNEIEFFIFDKIKYNLDDYNMYLKIYDRESYNCKNELNELYEHKQFNNYIKDKNISCFFNGNVKNSSHIQHDNNSSLIYGNNPLFTNICLTDNDGKKIKKKSGYFSADPCDTSNIIKIQICCKLKNYNISVEKYHHEVSTSQHEISLKYHTAQKNADVLLITKQVIKETVNSFNRIVTFMPKPLMHENGNGLHCNISLWKNGNNIFYQNDSSTFFLSKEAFYFINGIVKHAKSLQAFCNATINSYKRLVPGFETCQKLFYSFGSRLAVIRLSLINYNNSAEKRIEFRLPDYSNSPHLVLAAIILAGYDGMKTKEPPLVPLECINDDFCISSIFKDYVQPPYTFEIINHALQDYHKFHDLKYNQEFTDFFKSYEPECISFSMEESLDALEKDHDFLLVDNIFSEEYIAYKRNEVYEYKKVVTPYDFFMYFDS
ncbi:glutamine synthetase, putative, partial [Hepatocystis sp. ex Piliocolobus tephrosceles]